MIENISEGLPSIISGQKIIIETRVSRDICLKIGHVRIIIKTHRQLQYTHFYITKITPRAFSH